MGSISGAVAFVLLDWSFVYVLLMFAGVGCPVFVRGVVS